MRGEALPAEEQVADVHQGVTGWAEHRSARWRPRAKQDGGKMVACECSCSGNTGTIQIRRHEGEAKGDREMVHRVSPRTSLLEATRRIEKPL